MEGEGIVVFKKSNILIAYTILFFFVWSMLGIIPVPPAQAEKSTNTMTAFSDVATSDPNAVYIKYIVARGIITGFPDGSFHPQEALTRAQAAVIFTRAIGLDSTTGQKSNFKDIPAGYWAAGSIMAASQAGYIKGINADNFKPEASLTRAQGISLFMRLSKQPDTGAVLPTLNDINNQHWAARPIAMALDAGMIGLSADNKKFYPDAELKRGDLARMLAILLTNDPALCSSKLTATLTVKKGEVKLQSGKTEAPVTSNAVINPGESIITGENAEAELNLPDGSGILIKANTKLTIKNNQGRAYIKKDGGIGTRVENLEVELKQGRIFGALASNHAIASKAAELKEKAKYMVASLVDHLGLAVANPWYKTAQQKKVKVKVDMPWGVCGIRGSFWSNQVTAKENSTSLMIGEAEVTATEKTQFLAPGQATTIIGAGQTPTPAAAMSAEEQKGWDQEKNWIDQRNAAIEQNQGMMPETPARLESPAPASPINPVTPPASSNEKDISQEIVNEIIKDKKVADKMLQIDPNALEVNGAEYYLDIKNNIAYRGYCEKDTNWQPIIERYHSPVIYTKDNIPPDILANINRISGGFENQFPSQNKDTKYILVLTSMRSDRSYAAESLDYVNPVFCEGDISLEEHLKRVGYPINSIIFRDINK